MNSATLLTGEILLGLIVLGILYYLASRFRKFALVERLAKGRRGRKWLISLIPIVLILIWGWFDLAAAFPAVINLAVIWLLCDLLFAILRKFGAFRTTALYLAGVLALVTAAVYLSVGYYNAKHVRCTDYLIRTGQELDDDGDLKILLFADSHLGSVLTAERFASFKEEFQEHEPDLLFITGDFVDDGTTFADVQTACAMLGELDVKYGKYYVFGNHDRGYFNGNDFTTSQLLSELTSHGVTVLRDEVVQMDGFAVIGREDASRPRKGIDKLLEQAEDGSYTIVLNHQPNDYDAEAAAGADLVLSGHTHGGQMFPLAYVGLWTGANDSEYGLEQRSGTTFIVTSGIADWEIPYKTAAFSEYVVIDLVK